MRASTLFFLALFGAMVWSGHMRRSVARGLDRVCRGMPACRVETPEPAADPREEAVAGQIRDLERRGRDLDRSLRSIAQSEQTLRDLVRRHPDADVERELRQIVAGESRLRELKRQLEAQRVVMQARLEFARAGVAVFDRDDGSEPARPSPVDALSAPVVPVTPY